MLYFKRWCQRGLAYRVVSVCVVAVDRVLVLVVVVVIHVVVLSCCRRCRRCRSSTCQILIVRLIQRGMAYDYDYAELSEGRANEGLPNGLYLVVS